LCIQQQEEENDGINENYSSSNVGDRMSLSAEECASKGRFKNSSADECEVCLYLPMVLLSFSF